MWVYLSLGRELGASWRMVSLATASGWRETRLVFIFLLHPNFCLHSVMQSPRCNRHAPFKMLTLETPRRPYREGESCKTECVPIISTNIPNGRVFTFAPSPAGNSVARRGWKRDLISHSIPPEDAQAGGRLIVGPKGEGS